MRPRLRGNHSTKKNTLGKPDEAGARAEFRLARSHSGFLFAAMLFWRLAAPALVNDKHQTVGMLLLAATLLIVGRRYLRLPRRRVPWWGWAGLAIILSAEILLDLRVGWVSTFFTPIAWTGYILLADGLVASLEGESRLSESPAHFAALFLCSVPLWTIFEVYNLRLNNWTYVGIPDSIAQQALGFFWAFGTIWPAIYETADLVESLGFFRLSGSYHRALTARTRLLIAVAGLLLLVVPVAAPPAIGSYLFGAVWVGFALLLDPIVYHRGGHSLLRDWEAGDYTKLCSLFAAGWICGIFWEFWNYWAGARWVYIFPIAQKWKIFEMPLPGYFGFPAFAVECWAMYEFLRTLRRRVATVREPAAA